MKALRANEYRAKGAVQLSFVAGKHLVSFLRKHHRLISLFGAFILFATFIVKDEMKDRSKEALEDVRSAEESYLSQLTSTQILFAILGHQNPFSSLIDNIHNAFLPRITTASEGSDLYRTLRAAISKIRTELDSSIELAGHLGDGEGMLTYAKAINSGLEEIETKLTKLSWLENPPESRRLSNDENDSLINNAVQIVFISNSVNDKSREMIQVAKRLEVSRRQKYEFVTRLSYVLYPLGWFVAFAGKLLEPQKSKEDFDPE
jgi:hypothetical protein